MKDEHIIDLVNGELDGTNDPAEHQELATRIESDPSVKEYLDEMRNLDALLATVPLVDPPASLKSRIMHTISHQQSPVRAVKRQRLLDRIVSPFARRPAWVVAYVFIIGVVAGMVVLSTIQSGDLDSRSVQGTIANIDAPLAQTEITAGTTTARIAVRKLDDALRIDVHLATIDGATLSFASGDRDPIVIESVPGTPDYGVILPQSSTIDVILTSGKAGESAVLNVDGSVSK